MSSEDSGAMTDAGTEVTRAFAIGECAGLRELLEGLASRGDIELDRASGMTAEAAASLASGAYDVVLQATAGTSFWEPELAAIRARTDAPVILISSSKESAVLESALEADLADVLLLPQPVDNVAFAIRRAGRANRRPRPEPQPGDKRGWMVTVFSPKGGTGKTVTATNLAATLAKDDGMRTLLIDLDLQFGDTAIMLGIEPHRTIHDLVATPGELDSEKLGGYVTRHSSGLDLLAAPLRPEDAEFVIESKLSPLLEVAHQAYDMIIVDTAPFFHATLLTALDRTDELLLVCGPEVPALKNMHLTLRTLSLVSFPSDRISLVLNHAHMDGGLRRSEIERTLGLKVKFEIPNDPVVLAAINRGVPAVLEGSKAFTGAVRQLAQSLRPEQAQTSRRGGASKGA